MDIDENPTGVLIVGTLYWAFLLGIGLLLPLAYLGSWIEHAGLVPPAWMHVESDAIPWIFLPAFCLALLMVGGLGRFLWPLEAALMFGFGYGLLLTGFFASCLIVPLSLVGLSSDRVEGYIYLANFAGWMCYAAYLLISRLWSRPDNIAPALHHGSPWTTGVPNLAAAALLLPDRGGPDACDAPGGSGSDCGGDSD